MKTYGTLSFNKRKNRFDITCEPHVAIRLKRVFAKIDTWQYGTQSISATPENCRDLQWFLERYPLCITEDATAVLCARADKYREQVSLVERLLSGQEPSHIFTLKLPPRPYQSFAANLWLATGGLLLADEVGTGKTISALCGLTDPRCLPALVVTLTHLPRQWDEQIHKFTDLTTHILKKGTPYDFCIGGKYPDIIITNYHKLNGWSETLAAGLVRSVVFDEGHELRHRTSQKYKAAKHIANSVDFRLALTATPVVNYGGEIYNVLDVIRPGQLGTWDEFEREWCVYQAQKPKLKDPASFGTYAMDTGLLLRRTRKDIKRELPEVTTVIQTVEADLKVLDAMKGQAIELAKLILKQTQDFKGQKMQAAGQFDLKMRQATGIAKAPYVAEFVRLLIESSGEPVVLFAWHREVYSMLLEQLKDFNPVMYTGTESPTQKEQAKQGFIQGKSKVMLISLRAGQGLDGLQDVCHIAVFAELDWANIHTQCIGRIHRDGQEDPVVAYFLVADHGSDPIMLDVLGVKAQQLSGIINPNQPLGAESQENTELYIKKLASDYLIKQGVELNKEDYETPRWCTRC
jgi:SNF2 family DNA or RNA helicase